MGVVMKKTHEMATTDLVLLRSYVADLLDEDDCKLERAERLNEKLVGLDHELAFRLSGIKLPASPEVNNG